MRRQFARRTPLGAGENLWRPEVVPALTTGLTTYFGYYNDERSHQSLEDRTPAEVYGKGSRSRKGCCAF